MTFCPNCGAAVEGRFCAKCGATMPAAAASAPAGAPGYVPPGAQGYVPPGSQGYQPGVPVAAANSGLADNICALLCYSPVWLFADIIFLVVAPYNQNRLIRFHAFQSLFACAALFVIMICYWILTAILTLVSHGLLGLIMVPLSLLIYLGLVVFFIFMMYKAYNNEKVVLPIIGPLAEKQA